MATWSQVSGNPFGPPDSEPDPFAGASAPPPIASASAPFATPPPPPTEALERPNVAPAANRGDDAFGAFGATTAPVPFEGAPQRANPA